MSLSILEPGLQSRIVDGGRLAGRSLGMPVGGAADRLSFALGNGLVGNPPDAAALEITLTGPLLRADDPCAAIIFGAPFDLFSDRQPLVAGKTLNLTTGEVLRIRGTPLGLRAYLCVPGGFKSPSILGSRSGLEPVRAGQNLLCSSSVLPVRRLAGDAPTSLTTADAAVLRILPGSQTDWIDVAAFTAQTFHVAPASDRMGLRLSGESIARPAREMPSEPVCPGTVQLTNDGQCIILGIDGQTIGGYPKIAQVIRADLDCLGQLRPGASVRFSPVTLPEAEHLAIGYLAELRVWLGRLAAIAD